MYSFVLFIAYVWVFVRLYVNVRATPAWYVPTDNIWTNELGYVNLGTSERETHKEETKRLIRNLPREHPEVFEDIPIDPADYEAIFETAIHSIDGDIKANRGTENEDMVKKLFLDPASKKGYLTYDDQRSDERVDFKGRLTNGQAWAMDVKGGEGQSISHLLVPSNTELLVVWSHRKSDNTTAPDSRLNEVINRMVRWGFNQDENPALMVIYDPPAGARTDDGKVIPDVVVLPEYLPSPENPTPPMRDPTGMEFLRILYDVTIGDDDLESDDIQKHIWFHELRMDDPDSGRVQKEIYNSYFGRDVSLRTRSIDYDRISDVGT